MTKKNGEDRMNKDISEDVCRIPLNDPELAERMERRAARREALHGGGDGAREASSRSKKEAELVRETSTDACETEKLEPQTVKSSGRRTIRGNAAVGEDGLREAYSRGETGTKTVRETSTDACETEKLEPQAVKSSGRRAIRGNFAVGEDGAPEAFLQSNSTAEDPERGKAAQVDAASYEHRNNSERRRIPLTHPEQSERGTKTAEDDTVVFTPVRVKGRETRGTENAADAKDNVARSRGKALRSPAKREHAENGIIRGAKQTDEKKQSFFSKNAKPLLITAMAVCAALIIFASYMFISQLLEYKKNSDTYDEIENRYVSVEETAEEPGKVYKTYNVDFEKLSKEIGSEVSRWILFEDSVINYPIAYGTDNQFYVSHLADGTEGKSGAIFIDYRNEPDFSNRNTIIYGHHMKDGSMFAELVKYAKQDYMNEHPSFYILTPEESYEAQIFSAFITPSDSEVFKIAFKNDSEFDSYLQYVCGLTKVVTGIQPETSDRIVTLVTCTYEYNDARFIVQAKLKPLSGGEDSQ